MDWFDHRRRMEVAEQLARQQEIEARLNGESWAPWAPLLFVVGGAMATGGMSVAMAAMPGRYGREPRVPIEYALYALPIGLIGVIILFLVRRYGRKTKSFVDRHLD